MTGFVAFHWCCLRSWFRPQTHKQAKCTCNTTINNIRITTINSADASLPTVAAIQEGDLATVRSSANLAKWKMPSAQANSVATPPQRNTVHSQRFDKFRVTAQLRSPRVQVLRAAERASGHQSDSDAPIIAVPKQLARNCNEAVRPTAGHDSFFHSQSPTQRTRSDLKSLIPTGLPCLDWASEVEVVRVGARR